MDQFYVSLPSKGSIERFSNNTLAAFSTELHKPIELGREKYEVGLCEFQIDGYICNVVDDYHGVKIEIVTRNDDIDSELKKAFEDKAVNVVLNHPSKGFTLIQRFIVVPQDYYPTIYDYVHVINIGLRESIISKNVSLEIADAQDKNNTKLKLIIKKTDKVKSASTKAFFLKSLRSTADLEENKPTQINTIIIDAEKLLPKVDELVYIYTDIIEHQFVGSEYLQLLRVIQLPETKKRQITIRYSDIHYVGVNHSILEKIDVYIRTLLGVKVLFTKGSLTVKLHFRRIQA